MWYKNAGTSLCRFVTIRRHTDERTVFSWLYHYMQSHGKIVVNIRNICGSFGEQEQLTECKSDVGRP